MTGERKIEALRGWPTGVFHPEIKLIGEGPIMVWSQSGWQEKGSRSKL
jgi:hypothetical protein